MALGAPSDVCKRKVEETYELVGRMRAQGIDVAAIAQVLDVSEAEVSAALSKRQCTRRAVGSGSDQALLVRRLSATHPDEFVCPVLHSVMADPVVAEDGYSYDREAIEEALRLRGRSPITNVPIGNTVIPNLSLKSRIISYKEKYITDVIDVVPGLPPGNAMTLVERAEHFARDRGVASKHLVDLLRFRAEALVDGDRGSATKELVTLLMQKGGPSATSEILDHFDAWGIAAVLPNLEERILDELFRSAVEQGRSSASCACLGHSLASSVARNRCACSARGTQRDWQSLWDIAMKLADFDEPAQGMPIDRVNIAAVALIGLYSRCAAGPVDLASVQTSVVQRATTLLRSPSLLAAVQESLFGVPVISSGKLLFELLVRMRLELAARRGKDEESADGNFPVANLHIAALLSDGLLPGAAPDRAMLVGLLGEQGELRPESLLQTLQADTSALKRVAESALNALKVQLEVTGHQGTVSASLNSMRCWLGRRGGADQGVLRSSLMKSFHGQREHEGMNNIKVVEELQFDSRPEAVTCMCFGQERLHRGYVLLAAASKGGTVVVYRVYRTEMEISMLSDIGIPQDDDQTYSSPPDSSNITVHSCLRGHSGAITSILFNLLEDQLVTTSIDKSLRVWGVDSAQMLKVFTDTSPVHVAAFLPFNPGVFVAANSNSILRLVNLENGALLQKLKVETTVRALKFDDTGRFLLAGTLGGSIHVLEASGASTLNFKFKLQLSRGGVTCITFVPAMHGQPPCLLVNTADSSVTIIDCNYGPPAGVLINLSVRHRVRVAHSLLPLKCCYSPSSHGYLISGSEDKEVHIYSLATGSNYELHCLKYHQVPVVAVALNLQDTLLASGDSLGRIVLWRRIDFSHIP